MRLFFSLKRSVAFLAHPARPLARIVGQWLLRIGLRLSRVGAPAPATPLLDLILVEYEREKLAHISYVLRSPKEETPIC